MQINSCRLFNCFLVGLSAALAGADRADSAEQVYAPDWKSIAGNYQVPEWYQDAKFGIWPHWGIYSVPAFRGEGYPAEWYGRGIHSIEKGPDIRPKKNDPDTILNQFYDSRSLKQVRHHQTTYGGVEKFGYHEFADQWKAEKFDADEWAQMAVDAGAKFFCMMAQHHDSFSLYDSEHTEWDSVDKGPKRDLCREVKDAMAKRGLKFGVSNHMAWNSTFFNFYHANYRDLPEYGKHKDLYSEGVVDDAYIDRWWKRTTEVVDKLQPDLYYFDWGWDTGRLADEGYHQKFAAYYYNRAVNQGKGKHGTPGVVLCTKDHDDPPNCVIRDIERGRMGSIQSNVWQTDTSISVHSWGYSKDDEYHSVDYLIETLVDVVSKNGVLMLNFGPRADGTVAPEYRDRLLAMGKWLKVNGEAVYATRPFSIYRDAQDRRDLKVRYTRSKDNRMLYATAFDWPGETLTLQSLQTGTDSIKSVRLLGHDQELKWKQDDGGLHITLPEKPDHNHAFSVRIAFDGNIPQPKK